MQTLPQDVHVGMDVYDRNHRHIGTVDDLKFPENEDFPDATPTEDLTGRFDRAESFGTLVAEAFGPDELPPALRERLLREGYVRLHAEGLFAADRYILPNQIAAADTDELTLNVERDQLIRKP